MSRTAAMLLFVFTSALAGNALLGGPVVVPDTATWVVRLLFVLLAAGGLASVVASGPTRARIAGATIASLLGLLSIEIYEWGFGLFAPPDYPETYDARSKFELVLDMRAGGVEAYPTIHPAAYIAPQEIAGIVTMPFGGVANAVTVYCKENETGQYLVYDSDEMGFNNPSGIWRRTSVEVALIGDSFTQGACVLKGSFAELLRARFDGVLNLGSGNNGPLIELATIREHLAEFRPRTVLWFYYEGNDLFNLAAERQSAMLMRYLASDYWQGIRERQSQIDAFVRGFVNRSVEQLRASGSRGVVHEEPYGPFEVARLALLRKHLAHIALGGEPSNPPDLRLFARILERAKESVESWGGKLYFVYLPAYELLRRGESEPHREAVLETARSQGLPIVDIDALFRQRADPLDFFPYNQDGVHYTQEGNQLVAEALIRAIESRAD